MNTNIVLCGDLQKTTKKQKQKTADRLLVIKQIKTTDKMMLPKSS